MASTLYQQIYTLVRQIPPGHVSSYGRIAEIVGTTARTVGFAMAALPNGSDVPWQRVVNAQGRISRRNDGDGDTLQKDLLLLEGVPFIGSDQVDLATCLWSAPPNSPAPSTSREHR